MLIFHDICLRFISFLPSFGLQTSPLRAQTQMMNAPLFYAQQDDHALPHYTIPRRCCAFVLDAIFMALLGCAMVFAITLMGLLTFGFGWIAFHILPYFPFAYYILFIAGAGATPGQWLCGLGLRQNETFYPPSFAQACVWTLFLWVSMALAGLPFLVIFFTRHHRAIHDILSGLIFARPARFSY